MSKNLITESGHKYRNKRLFEDVEKNLMKSYHTLEVEKPCLIRYLSKSWLAQNICVKAEWSVAVNLLDVYSGYMHFCKTNSYIYEYIKILL